jgi:hypothetical protein
MKTNGSLTESCSFWYFAFSKRLFSRAEARGCVLLSAKCLSFTSRFASARRDHSLRWRLSSPATSTATTGIGTGICCLVCIDRLRCPYPSQVLWWRRCPYLSPVLWWRITPVRDHQSFAKTSIIRVRVGVHGLVLASSFLALNLFSCG